MKTCSIKARLAAALTLASVLACSPGTGHAGVISEMIARRRAEKQLKANTTPPSMKGQSIVGESKMMSVADHSSWLRGRYAQPAPGVAPSGSLGDKFKKRFAFKGRNASTSTASATPNVFSSDRDPGVFKTAR